MRSRAALAWLLALALLQAQAIGLWHRIAHPSVVPTAAAPHADPSQAFGHADDDDTRCRLFDALALAAGVPAAAPGPAVLPEVQAVPCGPEARWPVPSGAWAYLARAPPAEFQHRPS